MRKKILAGLLSLIVLTGSSTNANAEEKKDCKSKYEHVRINKQVLDKLVDTLSKKYKIPKSVLNLRCTCTDASSNELAAFIAMLKGKISYKQTDDGYIITQEYKDEMSDKNIKIKYLLSKLKKVSESFMADYEAISIERGTFNGQEMSMSDLFSITTSIMLNVTKTFNTTPRETGADPKELCNNPSLWK